MVRILYVHHGSGIGGAPLSLLFLIRGLDKTQYKPTVLCIHESEASEMFRKEGIDTIVMESIKDFSHTNVLWYPWWQFPKTIYKAAHIPFSYVRALRFLRKNRFDIVHLNTSTLGAFGMAAKRAGCRLVWHIREPIAKGYFGVRRWWVRKVIHENADRIVPICKYDASQLIQSERIRVVYNFVDFSQFDASIAPIGLHEEFCIDKNSNVVLMLGGSNPIKGTEQFVHAAVKIAGEYPETVFLIAGEIPDSSWRNKLNGRVRYFNRIVEHIPKELEQKVRFIGVRKDIPQLLALSSVLCFPSTVPHFARPVIEAAAMKTPAIASDLGGPRELVLSGETGVLVPADDSDALVNAIESLLHSPERIELMGEKALTFAQEHFDAHKNNAAIQQLYSELVSL